MANPLYGQNKADAVVNSSIVQGESPALSGADQKYITIPFDCYVRNIYYQVNVALTTALSTLVIKNAGTSMSGGGAIPHEAAIVDGGVAATLTTGNAFNAGDVLEIENDAAPGAGQVTFYVLCEAS